MYKDAHRIHYSPNPSSSPICSSSSSVNTSDPFQSNTSTLRKRAPMSDPGDTLHHVIQFTPSGSSSGTAPPSATHDEPPPASTPSSSIPSSPSDVQVVENTVEAKSSLDVATHSPARDPQAPPVDPNLRQTTWGIFKVAYVVPSIHFLSFAMLAEYWKGGKVLYRLLKELWIVDWQHCLEYYACTLWLIVSPSFSLCFAYLVLLNVRPPRSSFSLILTHPGRLSSSGSLIVKDRDWRPSYRKFNISPSCGYLVECSQIESSSTCEFYSIAIQQMRAHCRLGFE